MSPSRKTPQEILDEAIRAVEREGPPTHIHRHPDFSQPMFKLEWDGAYASWTTVGSVDELALVMIEAYRRRIEVII